MTKSWILAHFPGHVTNHVLNNGLGFLDPVVQKEKPQKTFPGMILLPENGFMCGR